MNDREALATAARLQKMGLVVRSVELSAKAKSIVEFEQRGGNRAMRRAAAKVKKRSR